MIVKLLSEHRVYTCQLSNCWKSHAAAHIMHEMIYMISDPVMSLYIVVLLINT